MNSKDEIQYSTSDNRSTIERKSSEDRVTRKNSSSVPIAEVISVMREKEKKHPLRSYAKQGLAQCRGILVEWMVQVGEAFKLHNATVHSSVALLDRILLGIDISRSRLQLVGCCCILIACTFLSGYFIYFVFAF